MTASRILSENELGFSFSTVSFKGSLLAMIFSLDSSCAGGGCGDSLGFELLTALNMRTFLGGLVSLGDGLLVVLLTVAVLAVAGMVASMG